MEAPREVSVDLRERAFVPELPPPPPPPLTLVGVVRDAVARLRSRTSSSLAVAAGGQRTAVAVLGALAAIAVLAVLVWRLGAGVAGPPPEVVLPMARGGSAAPASGASNGDGAATDVTGADEGARPRDGPVAVHAAGAVAKPGLYRLAGGSRVADLLTAAGGAAPDADVDAVNLAALLEDGQRVYVPRRGETVASPTDAGGGAGGAAAAPVVNLNTATAAELDSLPGVGPATAQAILDHRRERGRFRSVDELLEVRGIGEARLAALRKRVRV